MDQYSLKEGLYLGEGKYTTSKGGVLIIDQQGQLLDPIDEGSDVSNVSLNDAYTDHDQNV